MTPKELKDRAERLKPAPQGVQTGSNGELEDHPIGAIRYAEQKGIAEDGTIINAFTQEEKDKLQNMIMHGEFNQQEAAFLKYLLMTSGQHTYANFDDLGAMLGAVSWKSKGQPVSKVAAIKEFKRIMTVIAKKMGLKPGKTIKDVVAWLDRTRQVNKALVKFKAANAAQAKRDQRTAMREFWETFKDLNRTRRANGLKSLSMSDLQHILDTFPNTDGTRGLKSNGLQTHVPMTSVNYHGGSDAIDRKEGRHTED